MIKTENQPAGSPVLRRFIQRFGAIRGTILANSLTITIALIITSIALYLTNQPDWNLGIILAILCPLLIATPVYYSFFKLIGKLDQTEHELTLLAQTDFLTHTYNRRYFTELAERELQRSHNLSQPLSLLLLDIDHFKIVNDTYSHLVGDQILVQLGRSIRQIIRETDLLGRYGGDEFLLLLPNTNQAQTFIMAERICSSIAAQCFDSDAGPVHITISVGVSATLDCRESVMTLLRKADQALYLSKNAGGNRVSCLMDMVYQEQT